MTQKTPYIGYSNKTLAALPAANLGDLIACPNCGKGHSLEKDPTSLDTKTLFYRCKDGSYLGAVAGKLVVGAKPDVSGELG